MLERTKCYGLEGRSRKRKQKIFRMSMDFLWKGSMGKSTALLSLTTGLETTYNTLCFKATNLP